MANPLGATGEFCHSVGSHWTHLCPHRNQRHVLPQHHFTPHSTQQDPLCLQDQQHLPKGSCGVKYPTLLGSRVHQAGQHPKGVQGCPGWGRAWTGTSRVLPARPRAGTLMSWLSASTLFFPNSLVITKGKKVCADPKAHWVQKHLKDFEIVDF